MQDSPSFLEVHETLLDRYAAVSCTLLSSSSGGSGSVRSDANDEFLVLVRNIKQSFLPTAHTWSKLFSLLMSDDFASLSLDKSMEEVYRYWVQLDPVESSVAYARWLLSHDKAQAALDVIQRVRGDHVKEQVTRKWRQLLDEHASKQKDDDRHGDDMVVDVSL